jgi:hypothetical protein
MAIRAVAVYLTLYFGSTIAQGQALSKDDENIMWLLLSNRVKQHQFSWQQIDVTHSRVKIRVLDRMIAFATDSQKALSMQMPSNYKQCFSVPDAVSDDVLAIERKKQTTGAQVKEYFFQQFVDAAAEEASPTIRRLNKGVSLLELLMKLYTEYSDKQITDAALRVREHLTTDAGLREITSVLNEFDSRARERDKYITDAIRDITEGERAVHGIAGDSKADPSFKWQVKIQQLRLLQYGRPECF